MFDKSILLSDTTSPGVGSLQILGSFHVPAAPCASGSTLLFTIDPIEFFICLTVTLPAVHAEVKVRTRMTYSVSARVALTLAHTVTNMAGTPERNTAIERKIKSRSAIQNLCVCCNAHDNGDLGKRKEWS